MNIEQAVNALTHRAEKMVLNGDYAFQKEMDDLIYDAEVASPSAINNSGFRVQFETLLEDQPNIAMGVGNLLAVLPSTFFPVLLPCDAADARDILPRGPVIWDEQGNGAGELRNGTLISIKPKPFGYEFGLIEGQ